MKKRICLIAAVCAASVYGARGPAERLRAAAETFTDIMSTPDKGVPQDLLNGAACIVIIPGVKKGAFVVGGEYGKGFIVCRKENGVGWGAPGAVRMEGGSFGFQIGGAETDVIMLVMNRGGVERLLGSRFTLGADASVAAGPVGRDTSAQTDARMTAQILTYSRQRGVFAGISLKGATLREDDGWNTALYGKELHNKAIVLGNTAPPAGSEPLLSALNKYSSRK